MIQRLVYIFSIGGLLCALSFSSVSAKEIQLSQKAQRKIMGTVFELTLIAPKSSSADDAIESVFERIEEVDRSMSEWKAESDLSKVNQNAGIHPIKVPDELFNLLKTSFEIAEETKGAFDPTWAALWGLWKFDGHQQIPSKKEVNKRLLLVNWRNLILNETEKTAYLSQKGMFLGLGAIAKGYALQSAADELKKKGFTQFLLNAGGQVLASGKNQSSPWKVGVQHPRKPRGETIGIIELQDASVSTSGDYEHSFTKNGILYHHILDMKTGFPAKGAQSTTVIHPDATLADAYSTACFVLGLKQCFELAEKHGFDVLFIDELGKITTTKNLQKILKLS